MKNLKLFLILAIIIMTFSLCLVACNDNDNFDELDAPKNILENGTTISWSPVKNASYYEVIVDDGEAKKVEDAYFDMGVIDIGTYKVKIRAVGINLDKKTIYSEYTNYDFVKSKKLNKPELVVSGKNVSWASVEGADSYKITISLDSKVLYSETIETTSYSFDESNVEEKKYEAIGRYSIEVVAFPEDKQTTVASDIARTYYCNTEELITPQVNAITSTSIRWGSISHASSYLLKLYFDVPNTNEDEFVAEYKTSSNTYLLSSFDYETKGPGVYYVLVKAIGDTVEYPVYFDSDFSTRNSKYDLKVISDFDINSLKLENVSNKWMLNFSTNSISDVVSFTISLKTQKADNSSSLPTITKVLNVAQGDYTRHVASSFEEGVTYYIKSEPGYFKNEKDFDENETYYVKNGDDYEEKSNLKQFDNGVIYYVYDANHYEEALKPVYILIEPGSQFIIGKEYYTKDGSIYTKVEDKYVQIEKVNFSYNDTYYVKNGENYEKVEIMSLISNMNSLVEGKVYFTKVNGVYRSLGAYSDGADAYQGLTSVYEQVVNDFDPATDYYKQEKFNKFEEGINYYVVDSYEPIDEFEAGKTYYVIDKVDFSVCIDDLFYKRVYNEEEGAFETKYEKSDSSHYGKKYVISVAINGKEYNIIVPNAKVCDDEYVSYKIPVKADKTVSFDKASYKAYFNADEDAYNAFVEKYDGYYIVETMGDLQYIPYDKNGKYVLINDLDGNNYAWEAIPEIGSSGILDGNNHKIENVVYVNPNETIKKNAFVLTNNGKICNLFIFNVSSKINRECDELAGIVIDNNGAIENCFVQGSLDNAKIVSSISINNNGTISSSQSIVGIKGANVGGFVYKNAGTIKDSTSIGNVVAEEIFIVKDIDDISDSEVVYVKESNEFKSLGEKKDANLLNANNVEYSEYYILIDGDLMAGGFIAINDVSSVVERCTAIGNVTAKTNKDNTKNTIAGGFVAINNATIKTSHAGAKFSSNIVDRLEVSTSGATSVAGGFVGRNGGIIEACYSTSRTTGSTAQGGFVGENLSSGTISYSYSTGGIGEQTSANKGAFSGSSSGTIHNAYFYNLVGNSEPQNNIDANAVKVSGFTQLLENLSAYGEGKVFAAGNTIFKEPLIAGVVYVDNYEVSIKAEQAFDGKSNINVVVYNEEEGKFKTLNIVQESYNEKNRIYVGSFREKGKAACIVPSKDGDYRVVIYLVVA